MTEPLDAIDLRILDELQRDGSLSNVELARRVHLSPSPCLARVTALHARGVIARTVAVQPMPKLGPWSSDLERLLEGNERKQRRERLTLIRIYEELQGLGYRGG